MLLHSLPELAIPGERLTKDLARLEQLLGVERSEGQQAVNLFVAGRVDDDRFACHSEGASLPSRPSISLPFSVA